MARRLPVSAIRRTTAHIRRFLSAAFAIGALAAIAVVGTLSPQIAVACPFCSAVQMTLTQELDQADVAVIAQLVEPMPDLPPATDRFAPGQLSYDKAKFRIVETIRGAEKLADAEVIEVVYFGEDGPDKRFLITGIADQQIDWTTPLPLSQRGAMYVKQLAAVADSGADRLAFFQDYLEDDDPLLAQDSYDEFARAPYSEVMDLGPRMHRDQLLNWINDPDVGPSGRRLYLTMLGVCGVDEDVTTLEGMINYDHSLMKPGISAAIAVARLLAGAHGAEVLDELVRAEERQKRESLDALLACYLKLTGPMGLELVNAKFLGNSKTEYKYMHSAIMALRFHASETDVLPRESLIKSMRLALDHPDFADQIVPDLAQWEDWEIMPRLVQMFKDSSVDGWIRRPVASYLLVAEEQPGNVGADAAAALDELEALDPKTIEAVRSLSAFSLLAMPTVSKGESDASDANAEGADPKDQVGATASEPSPGDAETENVTGATTADSIESTPAGNQAFESAAIAGSETPVDPQRALEPNTRDVRETQQSSAAGGNEATSAAAASAEQAEESAEQGPPTSKPNRLAMIGVPLLAGLVLLAVFAALLRGGDSRPPTESST